MNILSIIKRTVKPKVCGNPVILSDPFHITKTTIFITMILLNNSFCSDIINEFHSAIDEFNKNPIINIEYTRAKPESGMEAEARYDREQQEAKDIALNKAEIKDQRYWVNGKWHSPNNQYKQATSKEELKDSDNDGYDDYTEFKHGTSPNNPKEFPAIRDGNNKKIFK